MAGQHTAVNTFPGLVHTARHTMRAGNTRSPQSNRKEDAAEGGFGNWGEVVTRQPFENERLDHLLSKETSQGHKPCVTFLGQTFSFLHCSILRVHPSICTLKTEQRRELKESKATEGASEKMRNQKANVENFNLLG